MKASKFLIMVFAVLFHSKQGSAQSLTRAESDSAQFRIYDFLQKDKTLIDTATTEFVFIVLETGKDNNIVSVHLLNDATNKGPAYTLLAKITPDHFKGWRPKNFPNATIVIPVYSNGMKSKKNYADFTLMGGTSAGLESKIIWQDKSSALTSGILYYLNGKPSY